MKKIIALVLFAAMLFAFVPAASATMTNAYTVKILLGDEVAPWYAAQKPGFLLEDNTAIYTGDVKTGINANLDPDNGKREIAANGNVGSTETITIELKGSYSDAEAHWYTANTNSVSTNLWGKAVKIPYTVTNAAGEKVVDVALVDGYKNYNYQVYDEQLFYYLDFVLTEDDSSRDYFISFSNNGKRVKITVKWDNTDNNTTTAGTYVTMKVVGYDSKADQYGNYTVDYTDMKWDAEKKEKVIGKMIFNIAAYTLNDRSTIVEAARWKDSSAVIFTDLPSADGGSFWNGFNFLGKVAAISDYEELKDAIAGLTTLTGTTIDMFYMNAAGEPVFRSKASSESAWYLGSTGRAIYTAMTISGYTYVFNAAQDTMDVRLKAFDRSGVAFPAGTVITVGKVQYNYQADSARASVQYKIDGDVYGWDQYLGKSSKYVNVAGEPTYVIDQQNCFVFSMDGITAFAMAAGYYRDFNGVLTRDESSNAYVNDDIVLLYQNQYKYFQLIFTNGTVQQDVEFSIYYKNIARTKSGITVNGEREITVALGTEAYPLPYILDDAYAMTTELQVNWQTADSKIVKITNAAKGTIEAVKVGTTYVYATDAAGNFQLFIVNVVDPTVVVEQPSTTAYKTYVVTASNLYVRSGPGTNYSKLGKVARGTEVYGVEIDGSVWVQVNYNGTTAYMSGKYLAEK